MRSGSNKWGLIVVKEPLLREGTGNDSCECLDLYDAFYVFSDPLPIVCTLIYRIEKIGWPFSTTFSVAAIW